MEKYVEEAHYGRRWSLATPLASHAMREIKVRKSVDFKLKFHTFDHEPTAAMDLTTKVQSKFS